MTTTVAKRDLEVGDILDGLGGTMVHGNIERADVARGQRMLPLGLSERARMIRPVMRGQTLSYVDVALDEQSFIVHTRHMQDMLIQGK
ncbi:MAG: hypothetical protein PVS3B3_22200 [Ktedonobacteraceae bacterium]